MFVHLDKCILISIMSIGIVLREGLGDRLLDLAGMLTYCRITNKELVVEWPKDPKKHAYSWGIGVFDDRFFTFPKGISIVDKLPKSIPRAFSQNTSMSTSMQKIQQLTKLPLQQLVETYSVCIKEIATPNNILRFPENIHKCIGIHLRRSDKIKKNGDRIDPRHETALVEYEHIMCRLRTCLENMIRSCYDNEAWFFVCSEEEGFKQEFKSEISRHCKDLGKAARFCEPSYVEGYEGAKAVTDMFCLSRCMCILQGIKYSTFSIVASIAGGNTLYNFGEHDSGSLIHVWKPFLKLVNNGLLFDKVLDTPTIEKISKGFANLVLSQDGKSNPINRFLPSGVKI